MTTNSYVLEMTLELDYLLFHLLQDRDDHVEAGPLPGVLVHADPDQSGRFVPKALQPTRKAGTNQRFFSH